MGAGRGRGRSRSRPSPQPRLRLRGARVLPPFVALRRSVRSRTYKNLKTWLSPDFRKLPRPAGTRAAGRATRGGARLRQLFGLQKSPQVAGRHCPPQWPRPSPPRAAQSPLPPAPLRLPRAPRPPPPLWSACLGPGMPRAARDPGPGQAPARAARLDRSSTPRGCAPAPASLPPPPARPPSLSRGRWKLEAA